MLSMECEYFDGIVYDILWQTEEVSMLLSRYYCTVMLYLTDTNYIDTNIHWKIYLQYIRKSVNLMPVITDPLG